MIGRGEFHASAFSVTSPFLILGFKMAIAATIVVATSMIAERSRPFVAAMVATLPVSAGPALFFIALDHDDAFMRGTLIGAMVTNLMTPVFCLAYAFVAQKRGVVLSLGSGLAAWAVAGLLFRQIEWTLPLTLLGLLGVYALAIPAAQPFISNQLVVAPPRTWYALPLRALAVSGLVLAVTTLSWSLGPYYSGTLAALPLVLSSLIAILHPRIGGPQTAAMIASTMIGLFGFGFAVAAAIATTPILGRYWALGLGLLICLLWNGAIVIWKQRAKKTA